MRHRALQHANCSIARTVSILGERWTLVILRQAFLGARRFEDYQRGLGIARNMLADRLRTLVDEGILERRPYSEHPPRHEAAIPSIDSTRARTRLGWAPPWDLAAAIDMTVEWHLADRDVSLEQIERHGAIHLAEGVA